MTGTTARMRGLGVCALVLGGLAVSACGDLRGSQQAPVIIIDRPTSADPTSDKPFDIRQDCMPGDLSGNACTTPTMALFANADPSDQRQILRRNRLQDYLLWRSEKQCMVQKTGITSTQSAANFGLNTVTTGATAVGAIVLAPAANILSAIGAISNGVRSHFNEDVYQQYIGPAIIKQIDYNRAQMLQSIMAKRGVPEVTTTPAAGATPAAVTVKGRVSVSLQDYTVEEALADVERYHQLCSVATALSSLLDPNKQTFSDTATGIQQRIAVLIQMQTANRAQAKALKDNMPTDGPAVETARDTITRLEQVNQDIARQIMVLQQQMLTAPMTVTVAAPKT